MSAQTFAPEVLSPSPAAESAAPPDGGRDAAGRFTKGNVGGPGNPYARHTAALRRALAESVTEDEIHELGRQLYQLALGGDLAAAKLLLSYAVGKPAPPADPDTLDAHEWGVFKALPVAARDARAVFGGGVQAGLACKFASILVPVREMAQGRQLADVLRGDGRGPAAEAGGARRPQKGRPGRKQAETNGSNGSPAQGQPGAVSTPDHPPAEANGSNGKAAPDEAPGRHRTASNGAAPKKRSKWWGFGQPFRRPANVPNGQHSD